MTTAPPNPVFVVGCPRSGTTLVYSILLASGEFPLYVAESRIPECADRYGSPARRANYERFLADFRDSFHFQRADIEWDDLLQVLEPRHDTFTEILAAFMEALAEREGKTRWAEKTPNNLLRIPELAAAFPRAVFVHVIRDGRSVVASQRKLGMIGAWAGSDPRVQLVRGAKLWSDMVGIGRAAGRVLGDRYLELRYRDLVLEPDAQLARMSALAGVDLSLEKLEAAEVGSLGRSNTAFENPMKGISTSGLDRWREQLTPEEAAVIEWAAGSRLRELGFEVEPRDGVSVPANLRLHAAISVPAFRIKRFLNRHTFARRYARRPLEPALDPAAKRS